MKASPTLVLAIIITVYGFVQPYKSQTANFLEIGVQVNFLVLLLIEATSNIRELYFTFPPLLQSNVTSEPECVDSLTGIAPITWILMPFYYLPLLVLTVVACVYLVLYIRYTSVASLFSCFVSKQSDTLQCCRQVGAWAAPYTAIYVHLAIVPGSFPGIRARESG